MRSLLTGAALAAAALIAAPASAQLADGSFESQGAASAMAPPGYCYFTQNAGNGLCAAGAWTGTSGLQREDNGAWPGLPSADGSYYGFVQSGGTLSQTFNTSTTTSYLLNWTDAGRPFNGCCNGDQSYTVSIDGNLLGTFSTASGDAFAGNTSGRFVLGAGAHTLTFQGLSGGDNTSYIDAVGLSGVPEPATWALMIMGFGAIGGTMRRRRQGGTAFA